MPEKAINAYVGLGLNILVAIEGDASKPIKFSRTPEKAIEPEEDTIANKTTKKIVVGYG